MFINAYNQLVLAQVTPRARYFRQGAPVISALLEKESISLDEYLSLTGPEVGGKLLEANIFSYSYTSEEVKFQSTLMKQACIKRRSQWKMK